MQFGRFAILLCTVLALTGCARESRTQGPPRAGSSTPAPGDTLANGFPRALAPKLASWFQHWEQAGAGVRMGSLHHGPPHPYAFPLAPRVPPGPGHGNV